MGKPRRSKTRPRFALPPEPSGMHLDVLWDKLALDAPSVLAALPDEVDERWGDETGQLNWLHALATHESAAEAAQRPASPNLSRLRQRAADTAERRLRSCSRALACVYVRRAREMYPDASDGQLVLLIREQFVAGMDAVLDGLLPR